MRGFTKALFFESHNVKFKIRICRRGVTIVLALVAATLTGVAAGPAPNEFQITGQKPGADTPQALKPWRAWACPAVTEVKPCALNLERIALTVRKSSPYQGRRPITMGIPIPKDTLWDINAVRVVRDDGKELPAEARVAATWTKGGSIRWLHLDFQPEFGPNTPTNYFLEIGSEVQRAPVRKPVRWAADTNNITVDSGVLKIIVSKQRGSLIEEAWLDMNGNGAYEPDERVVAPEGDKGSYFITDDGIKYSTALPDSDYSAVVESAGPMKVVIRTRGWYKNEKGERACCYVNRIYVYRGLPEVRLFTTWVITVDTDRFRFQDVATRLPVALKNTPRAMLGADASFVGTQLWESVSLPEPAVAVQASRHEGYVQSGGKKTSVRDIGGWADLSDGTRGLTVSVLDMEQQWPNAIEARPEGIVFHGFSSLGGHNLDFSLKFLKSYWGREAYERFELSRGSNPPFDQRLFNACGMAKTHELVIRFHGNETEQAVGRFAQCAQRLPAAYADPKWVCASGDVGILHHYDPGRFPEFEKSLQRRFTEYLDILDRLTPVYGFYDYGMGIPHYISCREKSPKGEKEYIYTGYRREYDIGYANPIVPWELFLRSGQDRYYRYAVAFSRHCLDAHSIQWPNPRLKKAIGWITDESGSWVYDSGPGSFTFNNWMEYLLLNYYAAGHERAMDVAVQFIDAVYDECVGKGPPFAYCGLAGLWHGNAALMYRALWEDRLAELYRITEAQQLKAWQRDSGAFSAYPGGYGPKERHNEVHRQTWREYGLYQATLVPEHSREVDEALAKLGSWDLRMHGWGPREPYEGCAYAYWTAYHQTHDPRFIKYAQLRVSGEAPPLDGYSGLCMLRQCFAWMKLAALPGAENVPVPVTTVCRRIESSPLFLLHERGKETSLSAKRSLRIIDSKGNAITDHVVAHDDVFGEYNLRIPADTPGGVFHVEPVQASQDIWSPFSNLSFVHLPDLKFMIGMNDGVEDPAIWFFVPSNCDHFQVKTMPNRKIILTLPDASRQEGTGPVWNVTLKPDEKPRLAGLKIEPDKYGYIKVTGVPPYAALSPEAAFQSDEPILAPPEPVVPDSSAIYIDGAVNGKALRVNANDLLEIPLGGEVTNGRERLETTKGTIEFFIRFNLDPDLLDFQNFLPVCVELEPSVSAQNNIKYFLTWNFRNIAAIGDGKRCEYVPIWGNCYAPSVIRQGRWYHYALTWELDVGGKLRAYAFLDGYPTQTPNPAPFALQPVRIADVLRIGRNAGNVPVFDFALDEMRISDSIRYQPDKSFQPLRAAFLTDQNTRLLLHFDGDTVGVSGVDGKQVMAKFTDKP